jgi:hypothetical protein
MRRYLLTALAAALLAAPTAWAGPLAGKFPAGSPLLVEWSGVTAQEQKFGRTAVGEFYADPEVRKFTHGELPKLVRQLREILAAGVPAEWVDVNLAALAVLRDRPAALGLIAVDFKDNGDPPEAQVALVVDVGAGPEAKAVADWLAFLDKQFWSKAPEPPAEIAPGIKRTMLPGGLPLTWGIKDGLFALTVGAKASDLFFGAKPAGFKPLTADEMFVKVDKQVRLGDAALGFYLNLDPVYQDWFPKLRNMIGEEFGEFEKAMALNGLSPENVRALGATLSVEDRGFRQRVYALGKPPVAMPGEITPQDLKAVPADAGFALLGKVSWLDTYDLMLKALRQNLPAGPREEFDRTLQGFQDSLKLDLRQDVLAPLGNTVILHGGPKQYPLLGGFTVLMSVKDAARLRASLEKVGGNLNDLIGNAVPPGTPFKPQFKTVDLGKTKITFLNLALAAPAWAVTDQHLVFTLFPQSTAQAAARLADPKAPSLAEVSAFRDAFKDLQGIDQLAWAEPPGGEDWIFALAGLGARFAAGMLPNLQIDFDSSTLPPYGLLKSKLFPIASFTRSDENGVYSEVYAPTPLGNSGPVLLVVGGAFVAGGAAALLGSKQVIAPAVPGGFNAPAAVPAPAERVVPADDGDAPPPPKK